MNQPSAIDDYSLEFCSREDADLILRKKTTPSIRNLSDSLAARVVEKGSAQTVISDVGDRRNYRLPAESLERFFSLYEVCRKEGHAMHYTERQFRDDRSHSGVMIDLDRDQASSDVQITSDHIAAMTRALCKIISQCVDVGRNARFHIFWIRKPAVAYNDNAKEGQPSYRDGLHALIPDLWIEKPLKLHLVEQFRGYMDDIFDDVENAQPPAEMVDAGCARNPVYFLGSCKPGRKPYRIVSATQVQLIRGEVERENLRVEEVLARPYLSYELCLSMYAKTISGAQTWLEKRQYEPTEEVAALLARKVTPVPDGSASNPSDLEKNISYITSVDVRAREMWQLLELLPAEYSRDYNLWIKVVFAIASAGPAYKNMAEHFSRKSPDRYNDAMFNQLWAQGLAGRNKAGGLTQGSIRFWARQEAPDRYAELSKTLYRTTLAYALYNFEGRIEHAIVAKILRIILGDIFASDIDDTVSSARASYNWYEFCIEQTDRREPGQAFKWKQRATPEGLIKYAADTLPTLYDDPISDLKQKMNAEENKETAKMIASTIKNAALYKSKLNNDGFLRGVCSQAAVRFRVAGFMLSLDKDPNLIGVGNGVLELYPVLRLHEGFHEFRVSNYTNTPWVPYDPSDYHVRRLMGILRDIYIEEDMLEYRLFHDSTALDAEVASGVLLLSVGSGANGKTFCSKLTEETLEDRYATLGKAGLLTDAVESSNAANEAQMHIAGKRYVYFDEFNREETLNIKRVKTFCNAGKQTGRKNYGSQVTYENICNPVAISNYDFRIVCKDYGTWRRIRYYRCKTTFVEKPDPANKYEKKDDRTISRDLVKDPAYKRAYLSILAHYRHRLYTEYGNDLAKVPCKTLDRETSAFQQRQDNVHRFVLEMMVVTGCEDNIVMLEEITQKYITWYRLLFGRCDLAADTVKGEIDNSCLSKEFINSAEHGSRILKGYRIRESTTEMIRPGERRFKVKK